MHSRIVVLLGALFWIFVGSAASAESVAEGELAAAFKSFLGKPSAVGSWKIVAEGDGYALETGADFAARKGPDVKFFLSPIPAGEITGDNATEDSVFIVQLDAFEGVQRFALPAGTKPEDYQSLVLHCEAYSKLWATSALKRAP